MARGEQPAHLSTSYPPRPTSVPAPALPRLTPRQQLFVAAYLINLNGAEAAIRAGYSPKHAGQTVNALLKSTAVQAAIRAGLEQQKHKFQLTADEVLGELKRVGFSNLINYLETDPTTGRVETDSRGHVILNLGKLTPETAAAVESIQYDTIEEDGGQYGEASRVVTRTKFKLRDKTSALIALLRHLTPQSGPQINVGIQVNLESAKDRARLLLRAPKPAPEASAKFQAPVPVTATGGRS